MFLKSILDKLQSNPRFPERLTKDLHLVFADLYMKQGVYLNALTKLRSAANITRGKNKKSRIYYLIIPNLSRRWEQGSVKKIF